MPQQIVRNNKGIIIYRTNTHNGITMVYNIHNVLLGWCQDGQTRNAQGKLIAQAEAPGLLLSER